MNENKYDFPFDKLPTFGAFPLPIYQHAVNEIVKANKVPPKLAYYGAVAAAGALAQLHVDVQMPVGGIVSAGVYVLLQGASGERKTKVDECLFGELRKPNKAQRNRYVMECETYKVHEGIWERKNKVLMDALGRACAAGRETDAIELEITKNAMVRPVAPTDTKLVFGDVTIEALKNKLSQSSNAVLLSSDGKKILKNLLLQNDADMNQIWSSEHIDVERVTRQGYTSDEPRLTFSVMIQTDALSRIMLDKGKEGKESGFFARVLFIDVGSTMGERVIDVIESPAPDLEAYNQRAAALYAEYVEAVDTGRYTRRLLKFSAEAARVWIAYFNYVESNIKAGRRYEKAGDHASKLANNVARVAADLHVLEGFEGEIGMDCLLCAIALCDEASRDYMKHLAPKNEDEIEAIELKDWLVKKYVSKGICWVELNKLLQFGPHRMRSAKTIHRCLEVLERDEYLVVWPPGSGGRNKASIELRMAKNGEAWSRAVTLWDLVYKTGSSR
ncbi:DUF3987 domain-containing protein [Pseudoxanthomonas sp.]|uniref:DUF3987 domain-containing protein n=1 Tax=Pseudoxanthomonas sp. TaxID=1871049 RepID=UPI0035B04A72